MRIRCYRIKYYALLPMSTILFLTWIRHQYRYHCYFSSPESVLQQYQTQQSAVGKCQLDLDTLGSVQVDLNRIPSLEEIATNNTHVQLGGQWKPPECEAWQKLAVVIPYRNRLVNLKRLLSRLHDMLRNQRLHYRIFVIEQAWNDAFNKGKLMNIGYLEALMYENYDCFVFHDVDMLPENDRNLYMCNQETRHLASAIDIYSYRIWYCNLIGGAVAINRQQMKKINGFSNSYWGWGHEDDDFAARSLEAGIPITNSPQSVGRYIALSHAKEKETAINNVFFTSWRGRWMLDGLNNPVGLNYSIVSRTDTRLYTNITVDVGSMLEYMKNKPVDSTKESLWWEFKFYNL